MNTIPKQLTSNHQIDWKRNYWRITGQLCTLSDLHVGNGKSGNSTSASAIEKPAIEQSAIEQSAIEQPAVAKHEGTNNLRLFVRGGAEGLQPYIPGTELKGVLSNWLKQHSDLDNQSEQDFQQLLGSIVLPKDRSNRATSDDHVGGKVIFSDAFLTVKPDLKQLPLPDFCAKTGLWRQPNNSISRVTGSAENGYLYFTEYVPKGRDFEWTLFARNLNQQQLRALMALLDAFNHVDPPSIGSGTSVGKGRLQWTLKELATIGCDEAFERALNDPAGCNFDFCLPLSEKLKVATIATTSDPINAYSRRMTCGLTLTMEDGFLVKDPSQAIQLKPLLTDGEPEVKPSDGIALPRCDANGNPMIPAESLKGVMRTRAEKILRSFVAPEHWEKVVGTLLEDAGQWNHHLTPDSSSGEETFKEAPSLVAQLFGASSWAGLLEFSDILVDDRLGKAGKNVAPQSFRQQHFVAINRVTGGAAEHLKFEVASAVGLRMRTQISIDGARLEDRALPRWMIGLLALVLRDMSGGDMSLGMGTAKGLGKFTASVEGVTAYEKDLSVWKQLAHVTEANAELQSSVQSLFKLLAPWSSSSESNSQDASKPALTKGDQATERRQITQTTLAANQFLNTFHFIPFGTTDKQSTDILLTEWTKLASNPLEAAKSQWRHVTHNRWVTNTGVDGNLACYSGRMKVGIRLLKPLVIGGIQSPIDSNSNEPRKVSPFQLFGTDGWKYAIPATSLRGLISSIAEAASDSSMRVLTQDNWTRRADHQQESLHAMGIIRIENGVRKILPLSLPLCHQASSNHVNIPNEYQRFFPPGNNLPIPMKIYWGKYEYDQQPEPPHHVYPSSGIASRFASMNSGEFFMVPLRHANGWTTERINAEGAFHQKRNQQGQLAGPAISQDLREVSSNAVVGTLPSEYRKGEPILMNVYNGFSESLRKQLVNLNYQRCILRLFGIDGEKATQFPKTRYHEILLPYPENLARDLIPAEDKCRQFESLAKKRTTFLLRQSPSENSSKEAKLSDGDIVCFKLNSDGSLHDIAIASVWRKQCGSLDEFVMASHPRTLPVGMGGTESVVTIADQMFGFVEWRKKDTETVATADQEAGAALASRIQFSHGLPTTEIRLLPPVMLKILDAPKPPSPSMYLKPDPQGNAIRKANLSGPRALLGRKIYLHGDDRSSVQPWKSQNDDQKHQKAIVTPIDPEGAAFEFHVSFDNLSLTELQLLCYALAPHRVSPQARNGQAAWPGNVQVGSSRTKPHRPSRLLRECVFSR